MGKTIEFKANLLFLQRKLEKLKDKRESLGQDCDLKEWFRVGNEIIKTKKKIMEVQGERRYN